MARSVSASPISHGPSRISAGRSSVSTRTPSGSAASGASRSSCAHHVQRHPPVAAGINPRRRLRRRPRLGQPLARHARRPGSAAPAPRSRPAPAAASRPCPPASPAPRRARPRSGSAAPASATKSPESGRLDQSALAVTWKSTTRPSPRLRPVTSGVPSSRLASTRSGRSGSGCAITWLEMSTSCGTGSPANGPLSGNGRSRRGAPQDMAPPIDRPPARSRTGSSGSSSSCPDARLRQPRPGEAHEKPALLHPGDELRPLRLAERAHVGEDQHVRRRVQHLAERRLDDLREGLQRLAQVVQRIDQVLPLAARPPGHHPDLAPPHRIVGQHHARRRPPVGELHPRHPVAELHRQVDGEIERVLPGRELAGGRPQHPLDPVRIRPQRHDPHRPRRAGCPARSTRTRNSPSSSRGGVSASAVCGGPTTVTGPWSSSARASSASPPWPMPSSSQSVSNAPVPRRDPLRPGRPVRRPGRGESPASRSRHSAPVRHGSVLARQRRARHRSPPPPAARCAPPRPAPRPRGPSAASSPARRPSRRRSAPAADRPSPPAAGSAPARRRRGSPPPAPASAAASSHQGVRSGIFSGSRSPRSSRTPGKARRPGAGGTARSSHQSTGSAANPSRSHGDRKATDPIIARSRPLAHRHVEPEQRGARRLGWCGGSTTASRDAARTR